MVGQNEKRSVLTKMRNADGNGEVVRMGDSFYYDGVKQSLVTDKNRKIRKFRELYPDTQLKVFYGRDFRSLVQKYGLSLTPSRSGAAGIRADERQPS